MREVRYLKGRGLLRRPRYPAADLSQEIGVWDRQLERFRSCDEMAGICREMYKYYDDMPEFMRLSQKRTGR